MALFALKKWYFDFLARDRTYLFLYVARASLAGLRQNQMHLSAARLGKGRLASLHARLAPRETVWKTNALRTDIGGIDWRPAETEVAFAAHGADVRLRYVPLWNSASDACSLVIPAFGGSRILWTPAAVRCAVSGDVRIDGNRFSPRSEHGYIDCLDSNVFPLFSPVRNLLWGRLHREDMDLTFTVAESDAPDRRWRVLILRMSGRTYRFDNLSVVYLAEAFSMPPAGTCPTRYRLEAERPDASIVLTVNRLEEAVVSDFLEDQVLSNAFQKAVYRRISGNPRGVKFFSHASLALRAGATERSLKDVLFIDECVRFGATPGPPVPIRRQQKRSS